MHRTQIALCYGTRPQLIKASVEPFWVGTPCVSLPRIVSALEPLVR